MMRATDLLGCVLVTESGERLGTSRSMRDEPLLEAAMCSWEAVISVEPGRIIAAPSTPDGQSGARS